MGRDLRAEAGYPMSPGPANLRLEYYWRYSLRWPAVGGVVRGTVAGLAGKEVAFLP